MPFVGAITTLSRTFTKLIFSHLYRYGNKFCKDDALIADTLQQLFTDLWHKRKGLSATDHIKNYLYKSFRRSLLRNLKKQSNQPFDNTALPFAFHVSHEEILIRREIDQHQLDALNHAIASLTEKQREVIYLKFYDGLSYAEISEITSSTNSQVYDLIYKALGALRKRAKKRR